MTHEDKFQAGEAYGDDHPDSGGDLLDDPLKLARQLVRDYAGVRSQATVPELVGLIKQLMNKGEPLDDRQG